MRVRLWWRNDGLKSVVGYKAIKWDIYAIELGKYFVDHQCPANIYVEQVVDDVNWFEGKLPRIVEGAIDSQTTQGGRSDKGTAEVKVTENDDPVRSEFDDSDEAKWFIPWQQWGGKGSRFGLWCSLYYRYSQGKKVNMNVTTVNLTP